MPILVLTIANRARNCFKYDDGIVVLVNGNVLLARLHNLPARGRDTTVALWFPPWCLSACSEEMMSEKILLVRPDAVDLAKPARVHAMKPHRMRIFANCDLRCVNDLAAVASDMPQPPHKHVPVAHENWAGLTGSARGAIRAQVDRGLRKWD